LACGELVNIFTIKPDVIPEVPRHVNFPPQNAAKTHGNFAVSATKHW